MGRKLKLGMRKKPSAKVTTSEELPEVHMEAALAENPPSPSKNAVKVAAAAVIPPSPGKQRRETAARILRLRREQLRKCRRKGPNMCEAWEVAKRVRVANIAKLEQAFPLKGKKRKSRDVGFHIEKAFVNMEWHIRDKAWWMFVLAWTERQKEVAEAELGVRDEKIAMLERRVRSMKKVCRNRKLGKLCINK